jgi:hypothetical protein
MIVNALRHKKRNHWQIVEESSPFEAEKKLMNKYA